MNENRQKAIETLDLLWEALLNCNSLETLKDRNGFSLARQFPTPTGVRGAYGYVYEAIRSVATAVGVVDFDGMIESGHNNGDKPSDYIRRNYHDTRRFDVTVSYHTGVLEVEHFQKTGVLVMSDSQDVIKDLLRGTPDDYACWSFSADKHPEILKKAQQGSVCNLPYGYIRVHAPLPSLMAYFDDVRR